MSGSGKEGVGKSMMLDRSSVSSTVIHSMCHRSWDITRLIKASSLCSPHEVRENGLGGIWLSVELSGQMSKGGPFLGLISSSSTCVLASSISRMSPRINTCFFMN